MAMNALLRCSLLFLAVAVLSRAADAQLAPDETWQPTKRWYVIDSLEWKVAPRHQPFAERLPEKFFPISATSPIPFSAVCQ